MPNVLEALSSKHFHQTNGPEDHGTIASRLRFGQIVEMTDKIVVLSTCATEGEAEKLARLLLEQHLAACVSVVPSVRSFYYWKEAIESAGECLLLIKTSRERFADLCETLEKAHSYQIPEVIAVPIIEGAQKYLDWMGKHLG
jgi:periplasmic divalent cation tolerance protein